MTAFSLRSHDISRDALASRYLPVTRREGKKIKFERCAQSTLQNVPTRQWGRDLEGSIPENQVQEPLLTLWKQELLGIDLAALSLKLYSVPRATDDMLATLQGSARRSFDNELAKLTYRPDFGQHGE